MSQNNQSTNTNAGNDGQGRAAAGLTDAQDAQNAHASVTFTAGAAASASVPEGTTGSVTFTGGDAASMQAMPRHIQILTTAELREMLDNAAPDTVWVSGQVSQPNEKSE